MVMLKDRDPDKGNIVIGYGFRVRNPDVSHYTTEVLLHDESIGWFWEDIDYFEPYNKGIVLD